MESTVRMKPMKTKMRVGEKVYSIVCITGKIIMNNPKINPVENRITLANFGGNDIFSFSL